MSTHVRFRLWVVLAFLAWSPAIRAQELSSEIIASFPGETVRIEFADLARLRKLPGYSRLREQYVGPRLVAFEASLAPFGLQEDDLDQIALAWQPLPSNDASTGGRAVQDTDADGASVGNQWPALLDGLVRGRFDAEAISRQAKKRGLPTVEAGPFTAHCPRGGTAICMLLLDESLGAFGSRRSLEKIVAAREGWGGNLIDSPSLLALLEDVAPDASIWGVALGPAVAEWFRGWFPRQGDLQFDWAGMLKSAETLQYSIITESKIHLEAAVVCKTEESATALKQLLDGLKLLQQLLWQGTNPHLANPMAQMDIRLDGKRISLNVTADYDSVQDPESILLGPGGKRR